MGLTAEVAPGDRTYGTFTHISYFGGLIAKPLIDSRGPVFLVDRSRLTDPPNIHEHGPIYTSSIVAATQHQGKDAQMKGMAQHFGLRHLLLGFLTDLSA
jgi:hypothetical protein